MADARLDAELVRRGLARSRAVASEAIAAGLVTVDGVAVVKPAHRVAETATLEVAGAERWVSRAAHKLIAALDIFGVDPTGRVALDAGASTGGFTQVLLERGAAEVIAVDVGHGQLAPVIREDPRVVALEGVNVRELDRAARGSRRRAPHRPGRRRSELHLAHAGAAALRDVAEPDADLILLIKPQFEVGRQGVREGIVRDRALRQDAVSRVLWAAWDLGLGTAGVASSPIIGAHGNREYLVYFSGTLGTNPTEWSEAVAALE